MSKRKNIPQGADAKPPMSGKKKLLILLCAGLVLVMGALGFLFVFVYDGFGLEAWALGWSGTLPADLELEEASCPGYSVQGRNGVLSVRVTRERSTYIDVDEYIAGYHDLYIRNADWQRQNEVTVLRDETRGRLSIYSIRVGAMPDGMEDVYTYVLLRTNTRYFVRALFKYRSGGNDSEAVRAIDAFANSVKMTVSFPKKGKGPESFTPVLPDGWSEETRETYERLAGADRAYFGAFSKDLGELEDKLGRRLPMAMTYFHIEEPLPLERLQEWYGQGKLTELTLQLTATNNVELANAPSPLIQVLSGGYDGKLLEIAGDLKAFGHPVLFRLNNEMNSDWTSYSGVVNLADPELYTQAWRYIYEFFLKNGVDNTIWIFNPNDLDFPAADWNRWLSYYPGDGYVQMLGVTGYNTGTYYADVTKEKWRSFREIYDGMEKKYKPYFGSFPWIITEFGSSSIGGDKAAWMEDMFERLPDYENIKAAVWFDYADFDPAKPETVSRPYWLAETQETLEAAVRGLEGTPERFFE